MVVGASTRAVGAVGAVVVVGYYLLPPASVAQDLVYALTSLVVAVTVPAAAGRWSSPQRLAWRLIASGLLVWLAPVFQ